MTHHYRRDISTLWSIWLPLAGVVMLAVLGVVHRPWFNALIYKEGPVEWLTVLVALVGAVFAGCAIVRRRGLPAGWLRLLPVLLLVGQAYIAGEESSWGQHVLNPRLPGQPETQKNQGIPNVDPRASDAVTGAEREEALKKLSWLKRMNDQGETNLHNLPGIWGDLFGKLPKQMVEFGSLFGCVIVPLFFVERFKLRDTSSAAYWFWPTKATTMAALIAFLLPWPKRIVEMFVDEAPIQLRLSETQELYLAITIALYAASMAVRLNQQPSQAHDATPSA